MTRGTTSVRRFRGLMEQSPCAVSGAPGAPTGKKLRSVCCSEPYSDAALLPPCTGRRLSEGCSCVLLVLFIALSYIHTLSLLTAKVNTHFHIFFEFHILLQQKNRPESKAFQSGFPDFRIYLSV